MFNFKTFNNSATATASEESESVFGSGKLNKIYYLFDDDAPRTHRGWTQAINLAYEILKINPVDQWI